MNYTIKPAHWDRDQHALRAVRTQVFVEEQSVPIELEWDEFDVLASHWLAVDASNKPIGTIRMLGDGHIGRMAVLADHRGAGIGSALLSAALDQARQDNLFEVYLYAQVHAVDFYQKAGFVVCGEEFMDANIPHRTMRLQLAPQRGLGHHGGNFSPESFSDVAQAIISQTQKQLRILSYDLDPRAFDTPQIEALISALARKSRYTDVRLLVVDTSKIIKRGHRLLNLQRRLSSAIQIRRVRNDPHDIKENLILADQCGIVWQSVKEPDNLWANFNNRPVVETYSGKFNDLWERGVVDHDLKRLEI